jgi:hypothetical protein
MKYLRLYEEINFKEFDETDSIGCDNYPEFRNHRDFCKFLLDSGSIDEFINRYNDASDNLLSLDEYLDRTQPDKYIIDAFDWDYDNDDDIIWIDLHCEWLEHLGKNDCWA